MSSEPLNRRGFISIATVAAAGIVSAGADRVMAAQNPGKAKTISRSPKKKSPRPRI